MIVDDALRRYCSMMYLQQCKPGTLDRQSGKSRWDHVMRVMTDFSQWCELWLDGLDEPTNCCSTVLEVRAIIPTARLCRQEVESLDARDRGTKLDR